MGDLIPVMVLQIRLILEGLPLANSVKMKAVLAIVRWLSLILIPVAGNCVQFTSYHLLALLQQQYEIYKIQLSLN